VGEQVTIDQRYFKYDYYSGANIGIYIGGNLITDAVGFEASLLQTKQPVFGYASSLYDGVAAGQVQVSGTLWLNFTQAQLMSSYVANSYGSPSNSAAIDLTASDLSGSLTYEDYEYFTEQKKEELKQLYWNTGLERFYPEGSNLDLLKDGQYMRYARPDQHSTRFDITVTYGVPFQETKYTNNTIRTIKGVHLTGFGQSITVDGEPVIETYPFFAREVI